MFTWILEKIYTAITYTRREDSLSKAHVGLKALSIIPILIAVVYCRSLPSSILLLLYPLLLTVMSRRLKLLYDSLLAIVIPVVLLAVLTWILAPEGPLNPLAVERALALVSRITALALTVLIVVSTTNPTALAMFLEKLGLPIVISQSIMLAWRLIPLVLRDLVESMLSLRLKGYPRWKTLTPVTAVSLERAYKISQTLYIKGFAWSKKRTYIGEYGDTKLGLPIIFLSVIISILAMLL